MIDYPCNTSPGNRNQEQRKRKMVPIGYDNRAQRFYVCESSDSLQKKVLAIKPIGRPESILIQNDNYLFDLLREGTEIRKRIPECADAYCLGSLERMEDNMISIQFYQIQKSLWQRVQDFFRDFWKLESTEEIR